MRVLQEPAFVLHNRPYSESSWIVELYSKHYGRLAVIAKGARRLKSKTRGLLLPFQPLLVSWSGKGEVPTLTNVEPDDGLFELASKSLVCGFYCNELIMRLLHRNDPHPKLFDVYAQVIEALNRNLNRQIALRIFEKSLLKEIGYGLNLQYEANSNKPIQESLYYIYQHEHGAIPQLIDNKVTKHKKSTVVSGKTLLAIANEDYSNPEALLQAKAFMRDVFNQLTGARKIHSRDIFYPTSVKHSSISQNFKENHKENYQEPY